MPATYSLCDTGNISVTMEVSVAFYPLLPVQSGVGILSNQNTQAMSPGLNDYVKPYAFVYSPVKLVMRFLHTKGVIVSFHFQLFILH